MRITQYLYALFRRAWRRHPRPAEVNPTQDNVRHTPAFFWGAFFLEDLVNRRRVRNPFVALLTSIKNNADEVVFTPCREGLAAEERCGRHAPALHLAFFHRQVDLTSAWVTQYGIDL